MGGLQATRVPALPGVVAGDGARVPWKAEALVRLPVGPADTDPFWRLAAAFLVAYPDSTAKAYLGDLKAWAAECESKGLHPFAARRHHVDAWVKALARDPEPATGRPASAATIARRLSCLSKFYDYGMREVELIEHSPVANVRRPKVSEDSPTIGLDAAELDRLLTAAEADGTTSAGPRLPPGLQRPAHRRGTALRRRGLHPPTGPPGAAHHPQGWPGLDRAALPHRESGARGLHRGPHGRADLSQPGRHRPALVLDQLRPDPSHGWQGRHRRRQPAQPPQPATHCPCFVIVLR